MNNLSPLDSRYTDEVSCITEIFSEYGLIRSRLLVEIKWFIFLVKPGREAEKFLINLWKNFSEKDALEIKQIERKTNHDVKALEYFLREKFSKNKTLAKLREFIHFAATSEDINNIAYAFMLKTCRDECLLPMMSKIIEKMRDFAHKYSSQPMLSHTHGQPASPTTVGKEFANFVARLTIIYNKLSLEKIFGKFNGTVGNFNAHTVAYPDKNWPKLVEKFVKELGLEYNAYTTQIEPHDYIAEFCNVLSSFNMVLIGFTRDIWGYISLNYFKQSNLKNEVGSSVMPHKINPINFENAEGNLGIANALLHHFSEKLPISRWQRDLSDSTVLRNLGVAIGHSFLAYKMLCTGLNRISVDENYLNTELNEHWEVLAEAIQTVMRRHLIPDSYEKLKELTRGKKIDKEILHKFINQSQLPKDAKKQLLALTPLTYLGSAVILAKKI